ncbi:response regulator [Sphingobacterium olei]|uniref:histidine kinase n=1 Tax=Sphingobacterium olei TaxID=2571155 RepID=A0A4U0NGK4_9SPHI|nr:two-component regulator propeller domain-containing protein [Sphingobacterium olei]TJZ53295.1 response regulator [Sphingobacterium olei]
MIRYIFLLFFLKIVVVSAQEYPVDFQRYYTQNGLSSNTIFSMCRDSYGFLWIGTEDGLNRFDGINYKVYRHNPDITGTLKVNHVTALAEDGMGRIWIGTSGGGLSFYDRKLDKIVHYEQTPDKRWLSSAITSLAMDNAGKLWVTSYGGLFVINVHQLEKNVDDRYAKLSANFLGKVSSFTFQDSKQRMWIATDSVLYVYSNNYKQISKYSICRKVGGERTDNMITSIVEDQGSRIWIGSLSGIYVFNEKVNNVERFDDYPSMRSLSAGRIYAMSIDKKGGLWIGTDRGLEVLDVSTYTSKTYKPDSRDPQRISHQSIRSILIDKFGIYWVGTFQGGLNKFDTNLSQFKLKDIRTVDQYGLNSRMITSLLAYRNDVLIGTDGGGIHLYDRKRDVTAAVDLTASKEHSGHHLTILALEEKNDHQVWLGTYKEGLFYYDKKTGKSFQYGIGDGAGKLNNGDVFCLKKDGDGNLWIGTNGGGINVLDARDGTMRKYMRKTTVGDGGSEPNSNFIRAFEEDRNKDMWIGTFGSGVCVFRKATQTFSFFNKNSHNLPSDYVLSLKEDSQGNIWVGTNGSGVGFLKKGAREFDVISERDGLINGVVQSIVEDPDGKIWFSTNKGLSCYDQQAKRFKNYSHFAGLQSGAFMRGAAICMPDGELFFGGQNGFNHYYPNQLKTNTNPANVVLTELKIDNEVVVPSEDGAINTSVLLANRINLQFKQNFSISFEALNLTIPEENQYQYMLEGFDKEWIHAGKEHSAYYTNLDPGNYAFHVRASNNDGIWNEEIKSIQIYVSPPFWRTIYAYFFYAIAIVGGLFYIRHRGIRKLEAKFALEQERNRAKQLIEQQRKEAEQLHQLDTMKIKFLTNLSHEFRTPISLIVGPVDNLMDQIKDAKASEQLGLVKRNARRLLNLVNQLLDFRKMEEQELSLQDTDGELVSFVDDISSSFSDMAQQKGIDYSFRSAADKLYLVFDQNKIERILFNILSNAFKFTPKGGNISVYLEMLEALSDAENCTVRITIKDSGIGIPAEAQEHIFESFFQHDTNGKVINQGTGIGLSIAHTFIKMYSGDIEVKSEVGHGSCFSFSLYMKRSTAETSHILSLDRENNEIDFNDKPTGTEPIDVYRQPTILIVEDDDDFRFYMKDSLISSFQVFEATNGKEGWQKALFHHPDIILCDVQMPVMNGMELAQKLTQDRRTKHIPVVLLTAAQVKNGLICGLEAGAVDYMTKPFDIAVLHAKINSLLVLNQAFKDVYTKQVSVLTPEIEVVSEKELFLQKILAYIYDNINNPQLSVENLSAHLSISRASLYNRLLEYTGMSPVDFIRSAKLERAVALLEKSDKTIAEIAYETGFANPNYFTKVFKSKYQKTPSEYIQSFKN